MSFVPEVQTFQVNVLFVALGLTSAWSATTFVMAIRHPLLAPFFARRLVWLAFVHLLVGLSVVAWMIEAWLSDTNVLYRGANWPVPNFISIECAFALKCTLMTTAASLIGAIIVAKPNQTSEPTRGSGL